MATPGKSDALRKSILQGLHSSCITQQSKSSPAAAFQGCCPELVCQIASGFFRYLSVVPAKLRSSVVSGSGPEISEAKKGA